MLKVTVLLCIALSLSFTSCSGYFLVLLAGQVELNPIDSHWQVGAMAEVWVKGYDV
jgi:hypothetical protein